jgi:hypothetical protein
MKPKLILGLALALVVGLLGWHIARQQLAKAFLERLRPPSADQVKKWAGFPESAHLTMLTNVPDDLRNDNNDVDNPLRKFKWLWIYEDRKGSNFTRVVIAVFEPGGFWPAKRALVIRASEQGYKTFSEQTHPDKENAVYKEGEAFARELGPMTMPNGQKSYGLFLFGYSPTRFAPHWEFDLLAGAYTKPDSYDKRYPPADLTEVGTNAFSKFFTNVDAFLTSQ